MKKHTFLISFLLLFGYGKIFSQTTEDSLITRNKAELLLKLVALPCGIKADDSVPVVLQKLETFIGDYQPDPKYTDDFFAKESVKQALKSVKKGGYGIGAVLYETKSGKLLQAEHNAQLTKLRSDLHAEMHLLNQFEDNKKSKPYRNKYVYKKGLTVFSSAEPCPMCFIRLATVGVDTKYCATGPDDGMVQNMTCLPKYWRELAQKNYIGKGNSSPILQRIAHVLFFSYLLDDRMPE